MQAGAIVRWRLVFGAGEMDLDTEKIDQAVLALIYLTLHDGRRAWKSFDWDAIERLRRKALIQTTMPSPSS